MLIMVTGPCEFLVMYDIKPFIIKSIIVTGPCEFLVMYDGIGLILKVIIVTGPCEFLVMYDIKIYLWIWYRLQDPVNF